MLPVGWGDAAAGAGDAVGTGLPVGEVEAPGNGVPELPSGSGVPALPGMGVPEAPVGSGVSAGTVPAAGTTPGGDAGAGGTAADGAASATPAREPPDGA